MKKEYLEGGRVCTAHGVRGLLKVEHMCDDPKVLAGQKRVFLCGRDGTYDERKVTSASCCGSFVLMGLEGIDTREAAIAMRGRYIYLHRDDIPIADGAMLIADMEGLAVLHAESGEVLGVLSHVSDVAGRRIYAVAADCGEVLIPDVPDFIKEISEEGMRILPIPGFFDSADEV